MLELNRTTQSLSQSSDCDVGINKSCEDSFRPIKTWNYGNQRAVINKKRSKQLAWIRSRDSHAFQGPGKFWIHSFQSLRREAKYRYHSRPTSKSALLRVQCVNISMAGMEIGQNPSPKWQKSYDTDFLRNDAQRFSPGMVLGKKIAFHSRFIADEMVSDY